MSIDGRVDDMPDELDSLDELRVSPSQDDEVGLRWWGGTYCGCDRAAGWRDEADVNGNHGEYATKQ